MKRKLRSALLLSALMTHALVAMEEEKTSPNPAQKVPQVHILDFSPEVLYNIFEYCDLSTFYALKQTCSTLHQIGSDSTFYLAEKPDELLKQLEGFIDQENQTFRFSKLLPLMIRTKDVGDKLYKAGESYMFDPAHPKEGQLEGFALWLAECAGDKEAAFQRRVLLDIQSFPVVEEQFFFHLLPTQFLGGPPLNATLFPFYKLVYDFWRLSTRFTQAREGAGIGGNQLIQQRTLMRDIFWQNTGIAFQAPRPRMGDARDTVIDFFRQKEMESCGEDVRQLRKFLEKRRGTEKEYGLLRALQDTLAYAENLFLDATRCAKSSDEKAGLYLKLASLHEEGGAVQDTAKYYFLAAMHFQDGVKKAECYLEGARFALLGELAWGSGQESELVTLRKDFPLLKKSQTAQDLFLCTLFLSWVNNADMPPEKEAWRAKADAFWEKASKTPEDKKCLQEMIADWKKTRLKGFANILEAFITQQWP